MSTPVKQQIHCTRNSDKSKVADGWQARCSCGWKGQVRLTREEIREDNRIHLYWEVEAS